MKLKFIRPVIAFCLTITLAFNSVILTFAAPEDYYDPSDLLQAMARPIEALSRIYDKPYSEIESSLEKELNHLEFDHLKEKSTDGISYDGLPLEIYQQQQERLLELLPGFYEKLCSPFDSPLAKELNHIDKISGLKQNLEAQKHILAYIKLLQNNIELIWNAGLMFVESVAPTELQALEEGQEQLQKLLEFSIKNNQKQLQKSLEASLKELKNTKSILIMNSNLKSNQMHPFHQKLLNFMNLDLKSNQRSDIDPHLQDILNTLNDQQLSQIDFKYVLYHIVKAELPKLFELFYEINNNNDYSSATYTQKKAELLKSLQDIIQELQRQEVERLQYQCNKQK